MFFINLDGDFTKRYDAAKFMEYANSTFDIINSYFVFMLKSLRVYGEYVVQTQENRPDLVSFSIYGNTQYWWILLLYNNIFNFEELPANTTLQYPSLASLEDLYFNLKSLETEQV